MKITKNTTDHLVLDDRPWIWAIVLGFMFLVFVSIALKGLFEWTPEAVFAGFVGCSVIAIAGYVFVRRVQLVFDRPNGFVELREQTFRTRTTVRHGLGEIDKAIVQTTTDDEGVVLSRLALIIPQGQSRGTHPVTEAYSNGWSADDIRDTVNNWLNQQSKVTSV